MSARIVTVNTIVVDCDEEHCMEQYLARPSASYEAALREAQEQGWRIDVNTDLCPTHAPKGTG